MVLDMKEHGKMIYNMDMVLKHGTMDRNTREITLTERNKAKACTSGLMDQNIMENGMTIKSVAKYAFFLKILLF